TKQSVHGRIKAGIARSFQLVNLFDQLTARDNVALTIFSREGKIANLVALAASDTAVWDEAHEILKAFGLEAKARTLAGGVSADGPPDEIRRNETVITNLIGTTEAR